EVIITSPTQATLAVQQLTKTIPIIFTAGGDPVINGVVRGLARPAANITGFSNFEPSIAGKGLELLKEVAPGLTKVGLLYDPERSAAAVGSNYISLIEAAAPGLGLQTIKVPVRGPIEIVRTIDAFAAAPNGGLLMLPPPPQGAN